MLNRSEYVWKIQTQISFLTHLHKLLICLASCNAILLILLMKLIIKCYHWCPDVLTFWFGNALEEGAKLQRWLWKSFLKYICEVIDLLAPCSKLSLCASLKQTVFWWSALAYHKSWRTEPFPFYLLFDLLALNVRFIFHLKITIKIHFA